MVFHHIIENTIDIINTIPKKRQSQKNVRRQNKLQKSFCARQYAIGAKKEGSQ